MLFTLKEMINPVCSTASHHSLQSDSWQIVGLFTFEHQDGHVGPEPLAELPECRGRAFRHRRGPHVRKALQRDPLRCQWTRNQIREHGWAV